MPLVIVNITVNDAAGECGRRHLTWNVGPVSEQHPIAGPLGVRYMLQLTDTQQVKISVSGVDKKGAPVTVPTPSFSSSDITVATVTADSSDANAAMVVAGLPGTCQIGVLATLVDGTQVTGVLDLTVVSGAPVSLQVSAGSPTEQA